MEIIESTCIIVFARYPAPGKVKTRLAVGCSAQAACEVYEYCLLECIRESLKTGCCVICFCSEEKETNKLHEWFREHQMDVECVPQSRSSDLGDRLISAIRLGLERDGISQVVIVGSDIPEISAQVILMAVQELESYDITLGPAADGGYYLIGMKKPHDELFKNMEWSTSTVLQSTILAAKEAELILPTVSSLPTLSDIDTIEDLKVWTMSTTNSSHPLMKAAQRLLLVIDSKEM